MIGRTRLLAMATAVALACLPASAQDLRAFYSGNDLWDLCSSKSALQNSVCGGYAEGMADALGSGAAIFGKRACIPLPVSGEQTVDVVKRFLGQHPEQRHYSAASLIAAALAEAFPCKP